MLGLLLVCTTNVFVTNDPLLSLALAYLTTILSLEPGENSLRGYLATLHEQLASTASTRSLAFPELRKWNAT